LLFYLLKRNAAVVMFTSFLDGDAAVEKSAGASVVDEPPSCIAVLSRSRPSIIALSDAAWCPLRRII
jgi:hypothetical protein